MRSAALCLLAISTSACNWLLGLDDTLLLDAGQPLDAPLPTARLTYLVAATEQSGLPAAMTQIATISPAPRVQIGRLGAALEDTEIDDDGVFRVPYDFEDTPWRLVFTLANDIPHEVHWTPTKGRPPHFTVPLFGRVDRAAIPGPATAVAFTATMGPPPSAPPTTHSEPRMFTTGVWTASRPISVQPGPTYSYNLNQSIQLSGPPGAPEHEKGDFFIVADYARDASFRCSYASGSERYTADLVDGTATALTSSGWSAQSVGFARTWDDDFATLQRIQVAAGDPTLKTVLQVGPTPSTQLPAFTQRVVDANVRGPVLLPMLDCRDPMMSAAVPNHVFPQALRVFPAVAHFQMYAERTVSGGLKLPAGIAVVTPVAADAANFDLDISLAQPPFQFGAAGTVTELGTQDGTPVSPVTGPYLFTFANEASPALVPDYYDVVLHRVSGSMAVAERIFTVTTPTVTIEPTVFASGVTYVFEIRSFVGAPDVAASDYTRFSPTQKSATVWTHTFVMP